MMNLEAFYALDESDPENRYEYIGGYAHMMTRGSPDTAIIGANLSYIFGEKLRNRPCIVYSTHVYIEFLNNIACLRPDVAVSCDHRDRHAKRAIHYPIVVVEVLTADSRAHDRGIKVELYQNILSVQEILLVDTQVLRIQLYRRETDYWTMWNFTQDDIVPLRSLGIDFPFAEVYEKTTFDDAFMDD